MASRKRKVKISSMWDKWEHRKYRHGGSPDLTNIPTVATPHWNNPTAFVLAKRHPDDSLTMVTVDDIEKGMNDDDLRQLAECAYGTAFMVMRKLLMSGRQLHVSFSDEEMDEVHYNLARLKDDGAR